MLKDVKKGFPSPIGVFLFIYGKKTKSIIVLRNGFRPLSGSFFLYLKLASAYLLNLSRFRPLSGSFFLYQLSIKWEVDTQTVSVPYRGLSFYIQVRAILGGSLRTFPSPIGVFLFIFIDNSTGDVKRKTVSVPYRGLSFYMKNFKLFPKNTLVSVPYRGLSFYI